MIDRLERLRNEVSDAGRAIEKLQERVTGIYEHVNDVHNIARFLVMKGVTVTQIANLMAGPTKCEQRGCTEHAVCWASPGKRKLYAMRLCETHRRMSEKLWTEAQGGFFCVTFNELRGW